MTVKDVKLLSDGFFDIDKGFLIYGKAAYYGKIYKAALKPLLVLTEKNRIIVDTGIGEMPEKYKKFYKTERTKTILDSLKEFALVPEDISVVINTHLHTDHCGNNALFKGAKFIVSKKELEYARAPDRFQKGAYHKEVFDVVKYTGMEGDVVIEEGVKVIRTPGHTPGHQSVIVSWNDRKIIYCGDVAPLRENLEERNIVGILHNPVQALESIDKLREIAGEYIFSHDNTQMRIP